MNRHLVLRLAIASVLAVSNSVAEQSAHGGIEESLGFVGTPSGGTEIRVWLGGALRVSSVFRVIKTGDTVTVERFAWTRVERPSEGGRTAKEAKRETEQNRRHLARESCAGSITESGDYLWCKGVVGNEAYWPQLFDDLLIEELWELPQQGQTNCKAGPDGRTIVVMDGEAVGLEIIEQNRRHSVQYWNPSICCPTLGCAIVDHVREVIRNLE